MAVKRLEPVRFGTIGLNARLPCKSGPVPGAGTRANQKMIRRRAWCERGEQTDFDALVQHVFGHGAIGCPFPARDGNQPAWADQHSVFAADFFRVFALFVVGWPHQWPQPDPDTADIVPGWPAP